MKLAKFAFLFAALLFFPMVYAQSDDSRSDLDRVIKKANSSKSTAAFVLAIEGQLAAEDFEFLKSKSSDTAKMPVFEKVSSSKLSLRIENHIVAVEVLSARDAVFKINGKTVETSLQDAPEVRFKKILQSFPSSQTSAADLFIPRAFAATVKESWQELGAIAMYGVSSVVRTDANCLAISSRFAVCQTDLAWAKLISRTKSEKENKKALDRERETSLRNNCLVEIAYAKKASQKIATAMRSATDRDAQFWRMQLDALNQSVGSCKVAAAAMSVPKQAVSNARDLSGLSVFLAKYKDNQETLSQPMMRWTLEKCVEPKKQIESCVSQFREIGVRTFGNSFRMSAAGPISNTEKSRSSPSAQ